MTDPDLPGKSMPGAPLAPPGSAVERLQRQQDRLRQELLRLRTELDSPQARELRRGLRQGGRGDLADGLTSILEAVEGALRAVRGVEGVLRSPVGTPGGPYPDLPPELPLRLRQFLDERRRRGRLEWSMEDDALRGWVLRWKEFTAGDTVRGSGRLYERPHAWLHD